MEISTSIWKTLVDSTDSSQSETVINNIFTNVTDGKVVSGILITDVSDHLPVFTMHKNYCYNVEETTTKN